MSPALKHIVFPVLSRSGYFRNHVPAGPAIVTYHGVFPAGYKIRNTALDGNLMQADALREQLRFLKKHYHVISPEDFLLWLEREGRTDESHAPTLPLARGSVLLTCDDALRNTLTEMLPILQELSLSCLFFATGESATESSTMLWYEELYLMMLEATEPLTLRLPEAGISFDSITKHEKHSRWWSIVESLSPFDLESRRGFLDQIRQQLKLSENWKERFIQDPILAARFLTLDRSGLRKMAAAGMSIGAHTLSHPVLARMSDDMAWREISESKTQLEAALGQIVPAFAYPFGDAATVTKRDLQLAEKAGFRCAFINVGGGFGSKIDRFAIPRVHVPAHMKLPEFEAHITGFYRTLRNRFLGGD